MERNRELTTIDKVVIIMVPFTILLSVILYFITHNTNSEIKSIVLGSLISMVLNYANHKLTLKVAKDDYTKLKLFVTLSYFIRFLILGLFVFVACYFSDFNVIYMLFGILEYPLFLVFISMFTFKGGKKTE